MIRLKSKLNFNFTLSPKKFFVYFLFFQFVRFFLNTPPSSIQAVLCIAAFQPCGIVTALLSSNLEEPLVAWGSGHFILPSRDRNYGF